MQNVGMSIKKTCKKGVMVLRLWVRRGINIGEVELLAKILGSKNTFTTISPKIPTSHLN